MNADNDLPHTKGKFYPEVKSQTGLSLLRISCKRAQNDRIEFHLGLYHVNSYKKLNRQRNENISLRPK